MMPRGVEMLSVGAIDSAWQRGGPASHPPRGGATTKTFSAPAAGALGLLFSAEPGCRGPGLMTLRSRSVKSPRTPQDQGAGGPGAQGVPLQLSATSTGSSSSPRGPPSSRPPASQHGSSGGEEVPASLRTWATVLGEPPCEEATWTCGGEAEAAGGEALSAPASAAARAPPGGERRKGDAGRPQAPALGVPHPASPRGASCCSPRLSSWERGRPAPGPRTVAPEGCDAASQVSARGRRSVEKLRHGVGRHRMIRPAGALPPCWASPESCSCCCFCCCCCGRCSCSSCCCCACCAPSSFCRLRSRVWRGGVRGCVTGLQARRCEDGCRPRDPSAGAGELEVLPRSMGTMEYPASAAPGVTPTGSPHCDRQE
mmetsp:Transcript_89003/g.278784  ORF Transcript_89003/g.278784 Transcript_89003/m.278784 type:complete len:370 (+) Transcript_89003:329-1438(+)